MIGLTVYIYGSKLCHTTSLLSKIAKKINLDAVEFINLVRPSRFSTWSSTFRHVYYPSKYLKFTVFFE